MKKTFVALMIVALLVALCCPAFANEFTPSIENKGAPEVVPVTDSEGNEYIGVIRNSEGEVVGYTEDACLLSVALLDAESNSELASLYAQLVAGTMSLPFSKLDPSIQDADMVIRDLIDVSFTCDECAALLEEEGVALEITFNVNVPTDKDVVVMTYKEGEWNPIANVTNNGDGTITCVFEHFCPVAIAVGDLYESSSDTGDMMTAFTVVMLVALCGVVALTVLYRRNRMTNN